MSNNRIEVDTVFGKLFAEVSGDPNYPGIHICVEQEEDGNKYDKQLALAECPPRIPKQGGHALWLMLWNSDHDDFTDEFTFLEEWPDREPKEVIWAKYLQYLWKLKFPHCTPLETLPASARTEV